MHEDVERMNARWLQQIKSYNALTLLSRPRSVRLTSSSRTDWRSHVGALSTA